MGWQCTITSGNMSSLKRGFKNGIPLPRTIVVVSSPPTETEGVLKFRTPLLRKGTAPSIPTGMSRNATYPYGTKHSSSLLRQKGMPRNRASFFIPSLNFTSLLTFIRILLFPILQFLLALLACVEVLDFRCEESGEGINDGLWQFDLVWILTFFLAGHSVLPQQQNFSSSTQPTSHSFPAMHSCQRLFP